MSETERPYDENYRSIESYCGALEKYTDAIETAYNKLKEEVEQSPVFYSMAPIEEQDLFIDKEVAEDYAELNELETPIRVALLKREG